MSIIGSLPTCAFVAVRDRETAKAFYGGVLGLTLISEDPYGVVYALAGARLRLTPLHDHQPQQYAVAGWNTADVPAAVRALTAAGIVFERYSFLSQDDLGIWQSGEAQVAWFKDPDGNVLSLASL